MSFIADLFKLGYAPLQHFDRNYDLDYRIVRYAVRVKELDEELQPVIEEGDAGDILGAFLWRVATPTEGAAPEGPATRGRSTTIARDQLAVSPLPKSPALRPIPGWWYAAPSVVKASEGQAQGDTTISRLDLLERGDRPGLDVRPIHDAQETPDERFEAQQPHYPDWAHRLPKGWTGSVASASEEHEQIPTILPAALGLVASNKGGDPILSTPVLDLQDDTSPDPARRALLHSAWRVVLPEAGVAPLRGPALAWQLGRGGPKRLLSGHGLCWDEVKESAAPGGDDTPTPPAGPGSTTIPRDQVTSSPGSFTTTPRDGGEPGVSGEALSTPSGAIGAASARVSGPFDVGDRHCPHRLGVTADGEPVNAMHLQTQTLFRGDGFDAPLEIQGFSEPFGVAKRQGLLTRVECQVDPRSNHGWFGGIAPTLRRWHVPIPIAAPRDRPPQHPPRQPPGGPGGGPGDGGGGGGGGGEGGGGGGGGGGGVPLGPEGTKRGRLVSGPDDFFWPPRPVAVGLVGSPRDWSVPALTFRAMPFCRRTHDTRYWEGDWTPDYLAAWEESPVVARLEAFAAELCPDYDRAEDADPRWGNADTAQGSIAILPGGIGLDDAEDDYAPAGRTVHEALLGAIPGLSRFASGVPIFSGTGRGGFGTGYDWAAASNGDLVWRSLSATGGATERVRYATSGLVVLGGMASGDGVGIKRSTFEDNTVDVVSDDDSAFGRVRMRIAYLTPAVGSGVHEVIGSDTTESRSHVLQDKSGTLAHLDDASAMLDLLGGTPADGDILYRTSGAWVRLPAGSEGDVLTISSGLPAWTSLG